jgi:hypothetical protein
MVLSPSLILYVKSYEIQDNYLIKIKDVTDENTKKFGVLEVVFYKKILVYTFKFLKMERRYFSGFHQKRYLIKKRGGIKEEKKYNM